jgi:hypothetical protein
MAKRLKRTGREVRRTATAPVSAPPDQPMRSMTIVARDPGVRHADGRIVMAEIAVPAEELHPGPRGYRVQVVDYDPAARSFHGAHVLPRAGEAEPRHWRNGTVGILEDRRFHAQNAYALSMRTLARFESALGRRLGWSFDSHQIKVAPHALHGPNAYYAKDDEGLVFGSFAGSSGTPVHTVLSHDVVVHEVSHALLDGLRPAYSVPSSPDQAAFHEGFSDVVALLSVFALPEIVGHVVRGRRGAVDGDGCVKASACTAEALRESALFGLAAEVGSERPDADGDVLRRSIALEPGDVGLSKTEFLEPHRRGEVFVAAVMRAFVDAWAARIRGLGVPGQRRYPLGRVVEEGADIADALLTIWIRAIDYLPPVHVTFGDAVSAVLTSDLRVRPDDRRWKLRQRIVESFASYGIRPAAPGSGYWEPIAPGLRTAGIHFDSLRFDESEVFRFLWSNREALGLRPEAHTRVQSVRPCHRVGDDGFILHETVVEYVQLLKPSLADLRGLRVRLPDEIKQYLRGIFGEDRDDESVMLPTIRGGGILVFDEYGSPLYHVHNDVLGAEQWTRLLHLLRSGLLVRTNDGSIGIRSGRSAALRRLPGFGAPRQTGEEW